MIEDVGVQTFSAAACRWYKAAHGSDMLVKEEELYLLLQRDLPLAKSMRQHGAVRSASDLKEGE